MNYKTIAMRLSMTIMKLKLTITLALLTAILTTPALAADKKHGSTPAPQQSEPAPAPKKTEPAAEEGIPMVRISPGSFLMGSSSNEREQPAHQVTINYAFEMGKTEVTQAQWKAVMGNNPSSFQHCSDNSNCAANYPVENVSWDDAQAFIGELNVQTGKNYRLPTAAEWEYACLAGGQHEEYCGNSIVGVAWYEANSDKRTHQVATKRANAWGLYDMSGNVAEWVQDRNDRFPRFRVLCGGGFGVGPEGLRAASRLGKVLQDERYSWIGFRLARTLP